jgi:hypothetical protein
MFTDCLLCNVLKSCYYPLKYLVLIKAHYTLGIYIFLKFLRDVKHVFNNESIIDLEHVRCLLAEKTSESCAVMCRSKI